MGELFPQMVRGDGGELAQRRGGEPAGARPRRQAGYLQDHVARTSPAARAACLQL